MPTIAELNVEIGAELSRLNQGLNKATSSVKDFGADVDRANGKMNRGTEDAGKGFNNLGGIVKGVGVAMVAAFSIDALLNIGRQIIDTTANFQKMEAVLTNTLGSQSAAQNAMLMIQDIAAKTPFSVEQLSESFVKLANRGIKPTSDEIIKLGDLAASTGKDFDQLTEAMLDAMTGEFERLKEFGVTAKAQGDKVAFTFKGVTTEVQKTDQAIKAYVLSLGDAEGVSGAMASISNTLGGKLSNLGDSFTSLFKAIGDGSSGPMTYAIDKLNEFTQALTYLAKSEDQLKTEKISAAMKDYVAGVENISTKTGFQEHLDLINERYDKMAKAQDAVLRQIAELEASAGVFDGLLPTDKANEIDRLRGSFNAFGVEMQAIRQSITYTQEAYDKFLASGGGIPASVGILKQLQTELKNLQDAQVNATSEGQIEGFNALIAAKEAEIKKYQQLGDAQRKQKEALQELNEELGLNKLYAEALGKSYDYVGQRISTLDGGIKNLIQVGFKPGSAAVQNFRAELEMLKAFDMRGGAIELLPDYFSNMIASIEEARAKLPEAFPDSLKEVPLIPAPALDLEGWDKFTNDLATQLGGITGLIDNGLVIAFNSLSDTIANTFVGLADGMGSGISAFKDGLKDLAKTFGQFLIKWGVGATILLNPLGPAAIIAGGALIALAGAGSSKPSAPTGGTGSAPRYSTPTSRSTFQGPANAQSQEITWTIKGTDLVGVLRKQAYVAGR